MARVGELDFTSYVEQRSTGHRGSPERGRFDYAYSGDMETREKLDRLKPVELAISAAVRVARNVAKSQLLGQSVKVGPEQFPQVHALAKRCADTLGINVPTLYIVNSPVMNAGAHGTNDDAFIMVHSALVDRLSEDELLFVLGHECGHIHNNHTLYLTALTYFSKMAALRWAWSALPAEIALFNWVRQAEITADRAGLLCCNDLSVAQRALAKLTLGSTKLMKDLNLQAFVDQYQEGSSTYGRFAELRMTHPWLPKRFIALNTFSQSALYRQHTGLGDDGLRMGEVDEQVQNVVKVS